MLIKKRLSKICRLRLAVMERLPITVLYIAMEMWNSVKARKQIVGFGILKGLSLIMNISPSSVYRFLKYTNFMLCTNFLAPRQTMRMNSYRKSRPCRNRERDLSAHCQASACVMYCTYCTYSITAYVSYSRHHIVHWLCVLPLDCTCNQIATWMFDRESCASGEQLNPTGSTQIYQCIFLYLVRGTCLHMIYCKYRLL